MLKIIESNKVFGIHTNSYDKDVYRTGIKDANGEEVFIVRHTRPEKVEDIIIREQDALILLKDATLEK
jgi:hypothetical protein